MIDTTREALLTLDAAAKVLPTIHALEGERKPVPPRTIYKWATLGKRGILLETVHVGRVLATSREALQRFFAALTEGRVQRIVDARDEARNRRCRSSKGFLAARRRLAERHGI